MMAAPEIVAAAETGLAAVLSFYPLNHPPRGRGRSRTGINRSKRSIRCLRTGRGPGVFDPSRARDGDRGILVFDSKERSPAHREGVRNIQFLLQRCVISIK